MGAWGGVDMDSLKFHPGPPCLSLPRPAGGPSLKQPNDHFKSGTPAGRAACSHHTPLWTPHAVRLCVWDVRSQREKPLWNVSIKEIALKDLSSDHLALWSKSCLIWKKNKYNFWSVSFIKTSPLAFPTFSTTTYMQPPSPLSSPPPSPSPSCLPVSP
jgi:hypothetical protein